MKYLFTLLVVLAFSANSIMAQTIVGTDPENKNVVLEEFTGIHCVYCPQGHAIAQGIYDSNPDDVVLINIHTGGYAIPYAGEPDFRTPWGDAIAGQSGLTGYPAGTVNRHFFPGYSQGGGTAQSRGSWVTTSNMVMAESSYLNIELEAIIVNSTRQLVVYVEVYYTGDSPEESNFLNVAILQNDILGPQTGGGMGNNYVHMHMLRHLLTGQWGVEIDETTTGSFYSETFTYELPMDYNDVDVILDDLDVVGFVTESHQETISGNMAEMTISYEPVAAFEGLPLSGYPPLSVDFTDLSIGLIDSWDWTFGDGNASTLEDPTNVYNTPGTYTVSLTVTGTHGTDTEIIVDYVEVVPLPPAPVADFEGDEIIGQAPFTVHFTDLSSSIIDDWDWDFGNGGFSGQENPSSTYMDAGTYTVSLTVSGPGGSDNETKVEYITVTEAAPEPDFMSDFTYGPVPLTVNFTDMSDGTVDTWLWEFGDGITSDEQNPVHIFTGEDYFDVSLTIFGPGGTETIIKEDYINTLNLVSVIISATPDVICVAESSQLDAEASGGSETYTYSWTSDPEGFVSNEQSPVVSPTETTTYMVEVSDGEQVVSNEIEVMVNTLPEITLGVWPDLLCNQEEPPVQLSADPENGVYSGDNVTAEGVFSPEGATPGWYIITYTYEDADGCVNSAQDSIFVDQCVGINSHNLDGSILVIFPNPNNGKFVIESDELIESVELFNQLGKLIYTEKNGNNKLQFNTDLDKGIYYLKAKLVVDDQEVWITKKVLIN